MGALVGELYTIHSLMQAKLRKLVDRKDRSPCPLVGRQAEKAMATHSSTFAWKIPWMEEPGRLESMGSLRVGHD